MVGDTQVYIYLANSIIKKFLFEQLVLASLKSCKLKIMKFLQLVNFFTNRLNTS